MRTCSAWSPRLRGLAHLCTQRPASSAFRPRAARRTSPKRFYDALDWWDDEPRALRALKLGYQQYSAVKTAFESEHGSIWSYLKDNLSTELVITAYANFLHGHDNDFQVGLARAILPAGTRDAEIHRIIGGVPASNRQALAEAYDYDFSDLGEGTLRADLIADQSGWELEKSLALLDHDLTEAEMLYFDSVAISGTHTDSVVERLQRIAGSGDPNAFGRLEAEWERFVRSSDGWTTAPPNPFTDMSIRDAMDSELSGEEFDFAMAAVDCGRERSEASAGAVPAGVEGGATGEPAMTPEQVFADENIRLRMHEEYIQGAAGGAGTNEEQIFDAVEAIRAIWEKRIRDAESAGDAAAAQRHRDEWRATQDRIRPIVNDEMRESGTENLRVRLLLAGPLHPADELYLAGQDFDNEKAVDVVTKAWGKNEVDQLKAEAREPRVDASGTTLRPSFDPMYQVPVTSGAPFSRIAILLRSDIGDIERGARRLKFELDEGTADSDCEAARAFLSLPGLSEARRSEVINTFVGIQGLSERTEPTPTAKFLGWLGERYEQSTATWEMRDLLDPSTDPQELLTRAQGRHAAAHSGVFDAITTDFARDWGHLTGEDTVEVEAEALARLEFIVSSGTTAAEVQGLLALTGKTSVAELAEFQYSEYIERLEELRALKRTIAEGIATAIEIAAAAAITAATGGAAGAALAAAIGSAIAGMLTREALLGSEYELLSDENLKQLVVTAATAGVGEVIGPAIKGIGAIQRLGTAQGWVAEALIEGSKAMTSEALQASLSNQTPTLESFSASVIRIAGSTAGAAVTARLGTGIEDLPIGERLGPSIRSNVAGNVVTGAFEQASSMTAGTGNLTAVDIAAGFGTHVVKDVTSGVGSAVGSVLAAEVAAGRAAAADTEPSTPAVDENADTEPSTPATDEADTEPTPPATDEATPETEPTPEAGGEGGTRGPREPGGGGGSGGGGDGDGNPFHGLTDAEIDAALQGLQAGTRVSGPAGAETEQSLVNMPVVSHLNDEVRELVQGRGATAPPESGAALERSDMEVAVARQILANPSSSPESVSQAIAAIVERAVADFRARWPQAQGEHGHDPGLTADALRGACGVGRDITADSIASLTIGSETPVVIHRIQAGHLGFEASHAFNVIALPDGTRFLVDPTFAQFADQVEDGRSRLSTCFPIRGAPPSLVICCGTASWS